LLVILTSAATWRAPNDELIPVGPFSVKIRGPEGAGRNTQFLVGGAGSGSAGKIANGWASFEL